MPSGGFWSKETLHARLPKLIKPFHEKRIEACSYELSLGSEALVSGENARKQILADGETVVIPPGQIALLITKEFVTVPPDAIAWISMKSKAKFRGLINVSGFHVDPGFSGKLVFSVFNAGVHDMHLSVGTRLFVIWYCFLDSATSGTYTGSCMGQHSLPDEHITNLAAKIPSPQSLENELQEVRREIEKEMREMQHGLDKRMENNKTLLTVCSTLFVSMLMLILGIVVKGCATSEDENRRTVKTAPDVTAFPPLGYNDNGLYSILGSMPKTSSSTLTLNLPRTSTKTESLTPAQTATPMPSVSPISPTSP